MGADPGRLSFQKKKKKKNAETGHVSKYLMSLCLGMMAVFGD